jgi:hypothetical protein
MTKRFWLSTVPLVVLAVAPARADFVSVTGGFTFFQGNVIGNAAPSFINGTQICPDAGCSTLFGSGQVVFPSPVETIDFYTTPFPGGPANTLNEVKFTPAAPQNVPGAHSEFKLGTITFENGIWSDNADFGFHLTSVSTAPDLNGHVFTADLHLTLTPNVSADPNVNADFIDFYDTGTGLPIRDPMNIPLPSLRVFELADGINIGSVDVYGEIGSLFLTRFANPTGGLFLDASHDLAPSGSPSGTVPEPSTILLLGTALAVVIRHVRPRNNNVKAG